MKAVETIRNPVRDAQLWPLSVSAYHALGELGLMPKNTELLYGFVYRKMPKSPLHCYLIRWLHDALLRLLPGGLMLSIEAPIGCADSEPEPDLAVIRGKLEDYRLEHPRTAELVIEVCVTSHEYDRSKLGAYASAGVKELWLVLAPEKQVEVYTRPANGQFGERTLVGPGGRLECKSVPELAVDLDALFET